MGICGGAETELDEQLRVLAHDDRRAVLAALIEADLGTDESLVLGGHGPLDLNESRVSLHHRHLPMLSEHGFVDWDADTSEVSPGPRFDEIEPLVDYLSTVYDGRPTCTP